LCHIHSLMPMRDAAQAACVSRTFLHSWRSHPNLNFSNTTLGLNKKTYGDDEIARDFSSKVDHILRKHSVSIKGDELGSLLSSSLALEQLEIMYCGVVYLKAPFMLQRLSYLKVFGCSRLRVIDSEAPNISSFSFIGDHRVKLSLEETLQMKNLCMSFSGAVRYTRVELPSSMANLETAIICSGSEQIADTPMLHRKYVHLKDLSIDLTAVTFPPTYDYFSLASFFYACPSLEILLLDVSHHHKIKSVKILGFTSSKSLVELTCQVVENIASLERLTLEAHQISLRCSVPDHTVASALHYPLMFSWKLDGHSSPSGHTSSLRLSPTLRAFCKSAGTIHVL
ncbi:hypothetical protein BAE44_0025511, partial [Dichanthelium oligosanthes]